MDLSNILAINGKPGLFKLITKGKNNFIVESLVDQKRIPAFSHDGVSSLDNIAIFTYDDDMAVEKIFETIYRKEDGKKIDPVPSDNNTLRAYFETIVPDYDKERVYTSHIKKVLNWYNILLAGGLVEIGPDENQEEKGENIPQEPDSES